ncbi:MAG: hypothetical protein WDZ76_00010 [Pseudohongiellaceae bacterium]
MKSGSAFLPWVTLGLLVAVSDATADFPSFSLSPDLNVTAAQLAGLDKQFRQIEAMEASYGPYDHRLKEALKGMGFQLKSVSDYRAAREAYKRALHISRVNEGLYNGGQIDIVEKLIECDVAMSNWNQVDEHYGYLEHLYRRLYQEDDPRLEKGLQKIVAWHIDAMNINVDGKQIEHLRAANKLFKLRLRVAELTLSAEDPMFDFLKRNIAASEYYLFRASDLNREMERQSEKNKRDRYFATLD